MAKLIGNYNLPGKGEPVGEQTEQTEDSKDATIEENNVSEFERRAMERLGGSIAFVMKGKNVVWNGGDGA